MNRIKVEERDGRVEGGEGLGRGHVIGHYRGRGRGCFGEGGGDIGGGGEGCCEG